MTDDVQLKTILLGLPEEKAAFQAFLNRHHLGFEEDLTYAVALTDENDQIVACGGTNGRLLKCFAVEESLRGNNALGKLIQALLVYCTENRCFNPMVVTREHNLPLFESCGFSRVAQTETVGLMERMPGGIRRFSAAQQKPEDKGKSAGAIVMNANPFTLGHRYLVETAAAQSEILYVFVVEEDRSVFPFADRLRLVKEGTADLSNVRVCPGGPYMISEATFPRYFLKLSDDAAAIQASLDATIFAERIAPVLGITQRFVGTEPNCTLTDSYNQALLSILPSHGITLTQIQRIQAGKQPVSASRVRKLLADGISPEQLEDLLPPCTIQYLQSDSGLEILQTLRT